MPMSSDSSNMAVEACLVAVLAPVALYLMSRYKGTEAPGLPRTRPVMLENPSHWQARLAKGGRNARS